MPFHMKIQVQPVDSHALNEHTLAEPVKPPVAKSRLKRLFERQFSTVLRNSSAEKLAALEDLSSGKDGSAQFDPSSVCLAKMVQNFIEGANDKHESGRHSCSCFNPNNNKNDAPEDEFDSFRDTRITSSAEIYEILRGLVPCSSVKERNLLVDTARIVEKNKACRRKDEVCRKIIVEGLLALGYDASICKSRWEKSAAYPAGEYEYVDVKLEGERLLIDVDFRSEFEIARPTKSYKSILQMLPFIYVGNADRLEKISGLVSEAAKQSLKKKGMHVPPWRKAEYVKAKWLSPCTRTAESKREEGKLVDACVRFAPSEERTTACAVKEWKPPEIRARRLKMDTNVVTGLASVMEQGH